MIVSVQRRNAHKENYMSLQQKYERLETLFAKYIKHVGDCEGTNFIDQTSVGFGSHCFTDEEIIKLQELEKMSEIIE